MRSSEGTIIQKYFDILNRFHVLFLLLPVVFCLVIASGLFFIKENNDGRIFFDENSLERQQLRALEQEFTESNSLILVLSSPERDVFVPDTLEAILQVTDLAWQLPHVTRVNSLSNYQYITSEDDDVIFEDLISEDNFRDHEAINEIKNYALSEQDLVGQIISRDGRTTAIVVNIAAPRGDGAAIGEIMTEVAKIRALVAKNYPGLTFYVTGDVPLDNAFSEAYAADLLYLFPVFLLVILLVCYLFFRSLILAIFILSMMILVVAATMGSAGFLGISLTAGTSGVPIILITISLADFIHLLSATRLGVREGEGARQAVFMAVRKNILPITLTSFTTFIGFVSLNFSDAPPFRDMGNLVALGIGFSYLITFTTFPVILRNLKLEKYFSNHQNRPQNMPLAEPGMPHIFSAFLVRRAKLIAAGMILLSLGISGGLSQIEFDDDWVKYFDQNNQFRQDTEFVVSHLTGVDIIEYVISSDREGGIADPAFLKKLDQFGKWALEQPEIVHVSSIVSLFKKMNFHMNGGRENYRRLADSAALNAQYLLMYEMSLPVGLDLNDRIDVAKEMTRFTVTAQDLTSRELRELDGRLSRKLTAMGLVLPHDGGTGIPLMFANLSERNIKSMLGGIVFALGLVSVIIVLTFKSLKLGLISFVVNILPIILGFGLWGWAYQYVGVSLTIVAAIAFGIVVDDSIHFLTKYQKEMNKKGTTIELALGHVFSEVGAALLITTFILVAGFLVLSFSSFQPTWALAVMTAVMIFIALIYDFFFLPSILLLTGAHERIKSANN